MNTKEQWEEEIRNKFISKFTVWNDKYRYATLEGKEEYPTPDMIADWWICSIREICYIEENSCRKFSKNIIDTINTRIENGSLETLSQPEAGSN